MRSEHLLRKIEPASWDVPSREGRFGLASLRRVRVLILFFCVLVSLQGARAQNVQRNNEAADLGLRSNLTVNPATRALEFQIQLGNYPGRAGHDVPVVISYSSKLWNIVYQGFASGPPPGFPGPPPFTIVMAKYGDHSISGWNTTTRSPFVDFSPGSQLYDQFGHPRGSGECSSGCLVIDRAMAWMPDGSAHELRSSDQALGFNDPRPDNLYAVDGSRLRYQRSTSTLFLPDGSRYVMSKTGGYIDRNGNTINATDTLGRTINNPLPYNPGFSPSAPVDQTYSLPGVGPGSTIDYILKWKNLGDVLTTPQPLAYVANSGCPPGTGATFSPNLFTSDISGRVCIQNAQQPFNPVVLSQVVLPTGQSYTFTYNIYGEIDKVTLPTGGYEKFIYAQVLPLSSSSFVYAQYNRGVSRRIVSPTGFSADEVSWGYSGGGGYVKTVAPDGTWTERYAWSDGNSWWGFSSDGARAGRAYEERVYSASNQMLRRKLTEWAMTGSNATWNPGGLEYANRNARITRETDFILDTGGGALARTTTYGYDLTYQFSEGLDQTSVSQYDYVLVDQDTAQTLPIASLSSIPNGTLLRTTKTAYLTSDANYRSRNIVGLPTAITVYKGLPTDSNVVSQQLISYDEGGTFAQLNDYGSVINWKDPQTPYRANPTTARRWLNYDGSTLSTFPNGTYLATHARYDQCGSVRTTWEARDTGLTNPSQISYQDAFSDGTPRDTYAFATSSTSAVPDASNVYGANVAFTTTTVYDYNTGKVILVTNPNAQTMSYDYTDSLNRLKQVTQPDSSRIRYNYSDAPGDLYVQVLKDEDSSRSMETRQYFDGVGRPIRAFSYNGTASTPWIVTDTYYDISGRVSKVSNPYRVSSANAAVPSTCSACTTTGYDTLGRVLTITTPDNAQVKSSYSGSASGQLGTITTVTDQAGRKRRSLIDVMGRLVRVDEPNADTGDLDVGGAATTYAYDVLGNLRKVTQGGQGRFFLYDSLGRLLRAHNPEQLPGSIASNLTDPVTGQAQWSVAYGYDANGNLTSRTDAKNLTATYGYDALNRPIATTYTDAATPPVYRYYDSATNGKGKLHWNQAVGVSASVIDAYDALGRPTKYHQKFWVNGTWGQDFNIARSYDKAGNVLTQTYPSGHKTNYTYDAAGRVNSDMGNIGDGVTRTYSSATTYDVFGGLQEEQFGTQTPLYNKRRYNLRGQLYDVRLSTYSRQTNEQDWNRGALINYFSANYSFGGSGTDNNGNLLRQEAYVPVNDSLTTYNFTEDNFTYDFLNRLKTVSERPATQGGYGPATFTQKFDYDIYGNRTINQAGTTQLGGINRLATSISTVTNRLYAPGENDQNHPQTDYDPAGNQKKDYYSDAVFGRGYDRAYDAENRMISSTTNYSMGGSQLSSYSYDANGRRIKRKTGTTEVWQVVGMDGELLAEYEAGAAPYLPQTEYGYRGGELLTTISSGDAGRLNRYVYNLYYGAKQADPTAQQLQNAVNQLAAAGATSQPQLLTVTSQMARALFTATNYETNAPARTDAQYVADLYYAYLQRGPDDSGLGWWTGQVAINGRASVCNAFESSGEFIALVNTLYGTAVSDNERTDRFINDFYLGAYGTPASPAQLQQQRDSLNAEAAKGQSYVQAQAETMGRALFAPQVNDSSISNSQYVTNLYEAFLQRGPDSGGLGFWSDQAKLGQGRQIVLNAFATSPPFRVLAGTLSREVNWLVTDHLATPRMVVNKSGTLGGVKRHDYLPFGEELGLISGRTTGMGYNSTDTVRQRFTSKERDPEIGLDYFFARYYSSSQGRFTSPDLAAGKRGNPQTLNRYSYVKNNPLKFIDPFGYSPQDPKKDCPDCANSYDKPDVVKININPPWYKRLWHGIKSALGGAGDAYLRGQEMERNAALLQSAGTMQILSDAAPVVREIAESNPQIMGGTQELPFFQPEFLSLFDESAAVMFEESSVILLNAGEPNAGGVIRSFVTSEESVFYRVYSENPVGGYLTKVPPSSSAYAREALALPPGNQATFIQEVVVPAGTRLQRSRALPNFGRQGGGEQFQLLDTLPFKAFGPPTKLGP